MSTDIPADQQPSQPVAVLSSEGLGAGAGAKCCVWCNDGDGNCVFPYYGVAPHTHERTAAGWVTTKIKPRDEWTPDFREDPDAPGCGTYLRCPYCGSGEPKSA